MGGGESIAKVISGSKLWPITTNARAGRLLFARSTYQSTVEFLTKPRPENYVPNAFEKNVYYHVAEAGDIIIQPAFAVHAVITAPEVSRRRKCWSLVTGFEAKDVRMEFRGSRVIDSFGIGMKVGVIAKEIQFHGRSRLVGLLEIRDYRAAVKKCTGGLDFQDYYAEAPVTTHVKVLFNVGYDLEASLTAATSKQPSKKRKRTGNLPTSSASLSASSSEWMTTLSELTDEEYESWPQTVLEYLDVCAPRRK